MIAVINYPGQDVRMVEADERLCQQLRRNPRAIPFVREAHEVEIQLRRPLSSDELSLEIQLRENKLYGIW